MKNSVELGALISIVAVLLDFMLNFKIDYTHVRIYTPKSVIWGCITYAILYVVINKGHDEGGKTDGE